MFSAIIYPFSLRRVIYISDQGTKSIWEVTHRLLSSCPLLLAVIIVSRSAKWQGVAIAGKFAVMLLGKKRACCSILVGGGADSARMRDDKSRVKALSLWLADHVTRILASHWLKALASVHCLLILHPRPENGKHFEINKLDWLFNTVYFFKLGEFGAKQPA